MHCVLQYEDLPEVTLSSLTETGQAELIIPVLKQRSYTGAFVIPSALANTPCADVSVIGFMENINVALGTSYTTDEVYPALNSILDFYKGQNCDFGTAYAHFRRIGGYITAINLRRLHNDKEEDRKMRQDALGDGRITKSDVPLGGCGTWKLIGWCHTGWLGKTRMGHQIYGYRQPLPKFAL